MADHTLPRYYTFLDTTTTEMECAPEGAYVLAEDYAALRSRLAEVEQERDEKFTADNLYDAYLLGCEDDAVPEPMSRTTFLAQFTGGK